MFSNPQSPTLLGSNLGTTKSEREGRRARQVLRSWTSEIWGCYVIRSLWNLLLSNSRLFIPGYTLSPRFLSLGNTRRVPVTRPPGTTSRSPGYPRRGALTHAGDYSTLTDPTLGPGGTVEFTRTRTRIPAHDHAHTHAHGHWQLVRAYRAF
jgi:hypothetical protein